MLLSSVAPLQLCRALKKPLNGLSFRGFEFVTGYGGRSLLPQCLRQLGNHLRNEFFEFLRLFCQLRHRVGRVGHGG